MRQEMIKLNRVKYANTPEEEKALLGKGYQPVEKAPLADKPEKATESVPEPEPEKVTAASKPKTQRKTKKDGES